MQRAFCFREMLSGDCGARAAVAFGVDFNPPVDLARLDRALTAVVERHPMLRARFVEEHGALALSIEASPGSILTRLPADNRALHEWCTRPVSFFEWPLCRAAVTVDRALAQLRIVVHHAIFDAESKDVFLRDLARAYGVGSGMSDGASVLRDAPFWRELVAREQRPREAATARSGRLRSVGPDYKESMAGRVASEWLPFAVEPVLLGLVGAAAERLGVSKFSVYLTAWHATVARLQVGDEDVVTAVAFSTRGRSDAREIGPFLNQLPIRSRATRSRSFRAVGLELAAIVRSLAVDRHQRPAADESVGGTAPQVSVSYRREVLGDFDWPGVIATPVLLPPLHATTSDVVVRMLHHGPKTSGAIDIDRTVLPPGYAGRLERCWRALLTAGAQRLDARIGELPLLEGQ